MHKNEIDIITLGCSKNLVDAERLMKQLELAGYHCVHDSEHPQGEIAIINTCGFIGDAKEESINTILQFAERKKKRQLKRLYVMGCLSERYMAELEEELPEVDKYYGKFSYMELVADLGHAVQSDCTHQRLLTTPTHYAYLKISEGCNRFCSYCAIPLITGRHTSRPMDEIVDEVRWLVSQGVHELNVIAQDLSAYGTDLYKEHKLAELVERISEIEGVEWIRLHYAYPTDFPEDLLRVMREKKNVCKYMDIALQHSTDHMLHMMRRHITEAEQTALIDKIRKEVPGICIRTTMMVGHPGETEEDFEQLKAFVKRMRFERMGAFAFSNEDGTYAYDHYEDDIDEDTKQRRVDELMALQEQIAAEISEARIGQRLKVVIDREEADYYVGRTEWDSPEVDCEVLITKDQSLKIGAFYDVLITGSENFDLYGQTEKI
ncbi:MAG: 30S ribosomal protein S12 methylthiotransferase RimO [Paludibacteraceae bacterium]|nr:30S ribosomal protein S12 methylthiotransferase RimO [Paludibacteraceae bacterium]